LKRFSKRHVENSPATGVTPVTEKKILFFKYLGRDKEKAVERSLIKKIMNREKTGERDNENSGVVKRKILHAEVQLFESGP